MSSAFFVTIMTMTVLTDRRDHDDEDEYGGDNDTDDDDDVDDDVDDGVGDDVDVNVDDDDDVHDDGNDDNVVDDDEDDGSFNWEKWGRTDVMMMMMMMFMMIRMMTILMMMTTMAVLTGRSGGGQMSAQLTNLFRTAQADSPARVMIMIKMIIMITLNVLYDCYCHPFDHPNYSDFHDESPLPAGV